MEAQTALLSGAQETIREKRSYPRIKDHTFFFFRTREGEFREAMSQDISAGGLCFEAGEMMRDGEEFFLELYAPRDYRKTMGEAVFIRAEVVWVNPLLPVSESAAPESNRYRIGLSFSSIEGLEREKLAKYAEDGFVDRRKVR